MIKHPWHEVSTGTNPPEFVNGIVGISTGMRTKYEVDKETGLLKLDRICILRYITPRTMVLFRGPWAMTGTHWIL